MAIRNHQDRLEAIRLARQYLDRQPVFLDTETTGIQRDSEIVEICIVDHDGGVLFQSLVKPVHNIPFSASNIHGITNAMVSKAPRWLALWPKVEALLSNRHIGIFNADFDIRMMQQTHRLFGIPWPRRPSFQPFCIMKLYAQFRGLWDFSRGAYRWISLEKAGAQMRIPLPNSHRAKDDTLLARAVLHGIANAQ